MEKYKDSVQTPLIGQESRMRKLALLALFALLAGCGTTNTYNMFEEIRASHSQGVLAQKFLKCISVGNSELLGDNHVESSIAKGFPDGLHTKNEFSALSRLVMGISSQYLPRIEDLRDVREVIWIAKRVQAEYFLIDRGRDPDKDVFGRLLSSYDDAYAASFKLSVDTFGAEGAGGTIGSRSSSFVDITGRRLSFPGLHAKVDLNSNSLTLERKIEGRNQISADLIRLFLEALFDAAFRTPAVPDATAVKIDLSPYSPYPVFDVTGPPIPHSDYELLKVEVSSTEEKVRSRVGNAVRGGSVFSSNNERLALEIETAVSVIAKKLTEHEGFCYYLVLSKEATNVND
jgi:hypothetical protein